MLLARHEHSKAEMERNRIEFYKRFERIREREKGGLIMNWELKQVGETKWQQDNSGYYTLIHHVKDDIVRIDFMDRDDMPVISFQGQADNVRKRIMQHISANMLEPIISIEHASYIGSELARCAILRSDYVQD